MLGDKLKPEFDGKIKDKNCEYLRISNELFGKLSTPSRMISLFYWLLQVWSVLNYLQYYTWRSIFTFFVAISDGPFQMDHYTVRWILKMHHGIASIWMFVVALASASKALCFVILHFYRFFRRQVFIHLNQLHTARIDIWASVLVLLCFVLILSSWLPFPTDNYLDLT